MSATACEGQWRPSAEVHRPRQSAVDHDRLAGDGLGPAQHDRRGGDVICAADRAEHRLPASPFSHGVGQAKRQTRSHMSRSSSSRSGNGMPMFHAALLTRMSPRPNRAATAASTGFRSATCSSTATSTPWRSRWINSKPRRCRVRSVERLPEKVPAWTRTASPAQPDAEAPHRRA